MKDTIRKFLGVKDTVVTPLDPEQIKRDETIKRLSQRISAQDVEIARLKAEETVREEEAKQIDKEEEFKGRLLNQEADLKSKEHETAFSFKDFLYDVKKGRYGEKNPIEITDKRDEEVLGIFGNFILSNGKFAIQDIYGNVIASGWNIPHVIYKPENIRNHIKRRRIPIPYIVGENRELHYEIDLENLEHPEMMLDSKDGKYKLTDELSRKLKYIIIDKDKQIESLKRDIETKEKIIIDIKDKMDNSILANNVLRKQNESGKTALTQAMELSSQFELSVGDLQRQLLHLTDKNAYLETAIRSLEEINNEIMEKARGLGAKSEFERTERKFLDIMANLKDLLPSKIIQNVESPKEEKPMVQPGKPLT